MGNMIKVGMADLNVCVSPDCITTLGLGSCIGIAIRDPVTKIGGLAHITIQIVGCAEKITRIGCRQPVRKGLVRSFQLVIGQLHG